MLSTPASRALAAAGLAGVLFVSTQLVSDGLFKGARLDLTQRHLYSLAPATKEVLGKLKDPITLRFFYSKSLGEAAPNYGVYANRVKELLEELASASDGKIKLEIYDPEPFSAEEDRANAYGLQPVPVDQTGSNAYFGLVGTNMTDDEQAIPFFQPQEEGFLHYDLTKLIYQLANPEKPQIAVISGLPIAGGPPNMQGQATPPWQIDKARRQLGHWTADGLGRAIQAVAAADVEVKGGGRDPVFAVERAILAITAARHDG